MATVATHPRSLFQQYAMYWLLAFAALVAAAVLAVGVISDSDSDDGPSGTGADSRTSQIRVEDDPLVVRYGDKASTSSQIDVNDDPLIVRYGPR